LAAASFARFGSYVPAYGLFAAVLLVGALLVARIGPYRNPVHREVLRGTPAPVGT